MSQETPLRLPAPAKSSRVSAVAIIRRRKGLEWFEPLKRGQAVG